MSTKKLLAGSVLCAATVLSAVTAEGYKEVLQKSLLFYEAQRSGAHHDRYEWRVLWRNPAALTDGSDVGRDLSGGWFDAGDTVKFALPMAYSASVLGWGMLRYGAGYEAAGERAYARDNMRFVLDYFLNAYDAAEAVDMGDDTFYYQVGDPQLDHAYWGVPESMQMARPAYACSAVAPCSEATAQSAAALAVGAMLFADEPAYAQTLLSRARQLYAFSAAYEGNSGYTAANGFYTSYSGYKDELAWAAIWLYRATGEAAYLDAAKSYAAAMSDATYWVFDWDNVANGVNLLLYEATGDALYGDKVAANMQHHMYGVSTTAGGLRWFSQWGSLRYAANSAFIALAYSDSVSDTALQGTLRDYARSQIDYMLGDNPRGSSYVVGYGVNPPRNPHHRAAHASPTFSIDEPLINTYVLEGALVGGPKSLDDFDWVDDRHDYIGNEVATDYNAAFSGALAGLIANDTAQTLLAVDFDTYAAGAYERRVWEADWAAPSWNNGFDEGRVTLAADPSGCGTAMEVLYPAGVAGTAGGAQWKRLFASHDELYSSYRVRFGEGFDFVKGGKLPGLAGGTAPTGGTQADGYNGWSGRMMWRAGGALTQYMYYPDNTQSFGEDFPWMLDGAPVTLQSGRWYTLINRVKMNTPGLHDGELQGWIDGRLALDIKGLRFRDTDAFGIDMLYFSSFFGGSDSTWAPTKDEHVLFDDFKVSTLYPVAGACTATQSSSSQSSAASSTSSSSASSLPSTGTPAVSITISSQWNGGACKKIGITNTSSAPLEWSLTLQESGTVYNYWSALLQQSGGEVQLSGLSWNRVLAPSEFTEVGYCVEYAAVSSAASSASAVTSAASSVSSVVSSSSSVAVSSAASVSSSASALQIDEFYSSTWQSGYCKKITLLNPSDAAVTWNLERSIEGTMVSSWSGVFVQNGATLAISGLAWNAMLKPGKSTTVGYCADY